MITYRENRNDIIQSVEIDLTGMPAHCRQEIESKIKHIDTEHRKIFKFEAGNKLVYETEVLIPKVKRENRLSILMVLGNPAVHSVADKMIFSYEKTRNGGKREHRFWKALKEFKVVELDIFNPTPEYNNYKRECLLNGNYHGDFNIFLLPYFSFPTPASGQYNGVNGIRKIVGKEIFETMKKREFQRFERIVLGNDIRHVICFQKTDVGKEIIQKADGKQVDNILELGGALKHAILYTAPPTRSLYAKQGKERLEAILSDISIRAKSR